MTSLIVLGRTGTGKSTFINHFAGKDLAKVSDDIYSSTANCEAYSVTVEANDIPYQVKLIDTPGFADNRRENKIPDEDIILKICDVLKEVSAGFKVGLLCMSAAKTRFDKHDKDELNLFKSLFSDKLVTHLVLVFTHLNQLNEDGIKSAKTRWAQPEMEKFLGKDCPARSVFFNMDDKEGMKEIRKEIMTFANGLEVLTPNIAVQYAQKVNYETTDKKAKMIEFAKTDAGRSLLLDWIKEYESRIANLDKTKKNNEDLKEELELKLENLKEKLEAL